MAGALGRNSAAEEVLAHLAAHRNETNIAGMARYGIVTDTALGISNTDLRAIGRTIGRDHARSLALWASCIREARLLAAFTEEPEKVTLDQAKAWADTFNSWEMVDGVAELFVKAGLSLALIPEFAADEREFVRRAAFTMIAGAAVHLKKAPDETLLDLLPLIRVHSDDNRNFVRKAVSWALRSIGKRNPNCHGPALALARELSESAGKTARWIGRDAVRELTSGKILARLKLQEEADAGSLASGM